MSELHQFKQVLARRQQPIDNPHTRLVNYPFSAVRMTDEIIVRAADIYADLRTRGELIGDADILIAATALVHNLPLKTLNIKHFNRIPHLILV